MILLKYTEVRLFFLLIFSTKLLLGQNPYGKDPRPLLEYADHLAQEKDFYRAIGEYKRVLYFFPDYPKREWVLLQIGRAYYLGERYAQAKEYLIPLTESKDEKLSYLARHYLAFSFYGHGDYIPARDLFSELWLSESSSQAVDYGIYAGMSALRSKNFTQAREIFQRTERVCEQKEKKDFLVDAESTVNELLQKTPPSRLWAMFWAVVFPGAGHLYLGQWDNALVVFLIVGATGFLAYDGFRTQSYVQAGIFTTISTGFYLGSLYSAYSQSGKIRSEWGEQEADKLEKKLRQLSFTLSYRLSY
ncbi:MAG: tetratricopeptide repeat protein [Leptospiraceae bacterium]|nr:tetratricopeptide repeat protein [Leptospiraceae bacterium]MDW8307196.1 tetratricopeptide repeat protein [Leptospiraceae bacterium]